MAALLRKRGAAIACLWLPSPREATAPSWVPDLGATVLNTVCCAGVRVVLWRWGRLRASGVAVLGGLRR